MKKLLLIFSVIAFSIQAYGQNPCNGVVCLSGDFTNVGSDELYTLSALSGTLEITSVTGSFITGFQVQNENVPNLEGVDVDFSRATCAQRTTTMTVNYTHNGNSASISVQVTIASINPVATTPNPVTVGYSQHNRFTMTTSASVADEYDWDMVTGGYIVGPDNQATVVIQPYNGVCSVVASVRAVTGCGSSSSVSKSITIYNPSFIGNIAGPQSVGTSYGDYSSYSVYPGGSGNASKYWVWSVSGPFQLGGGYNATQTVFITTYSGYGSGNLYVYAKNSCGQSSVASKYITVGSGYPGGRSPEWQEVKDPVLISAQGVQKLIVPYYEDVEKVIIYDMSGEVVESLTPEAVEVAMNGLSNDIYVVKTIRSNGQVSTTKTRISN